MRRFFKYFSSWRRFWERGIWSIFQNFNFGEDVCKYQEKKYYKNMKCLGSHNEAKHTRAPVHLMEWKKAFAAPVQLWKPPKTQRNPWLRANPDTISSSDQLGEASFNDWKRHNSRHSDLKKYGKSGVKFPWVKGRTFQALKVAATTKSATGTRYKSQPAGVAVCKALYEPPEAMAAKYSGRSLRNSAYSLAPTATLISGTVWAVSALYGGFHWLYTA